MCFFVGAECQNWHNLEVINATDANAQHIQSSSFETATIEYLPVSVSVCASVSRITYKINCSGSLFVKRA